MKKMILGIGIFICGVICFCTDYAVESVIDAIPGVTAIHGSGLFSLTVVGIVIMVIGVVLSAAGYFE